MDIKDNISSAAPSTSSSEVKAESGSSVLRTIILVLGDALVFFIFATVGRRSHGELAGLGAMVQTALTAAPFAIGWFLVAPFVGVYRRQVVTQPRKMFLRTLLSWVAAWPVAMILRGIFVDHAVPPATFALITLVSNTIFLPIWRGLFLVGRGLIGRLQKQ